MPLDPQLAAAIEEHIKKREEAAYQRGADEMRAAILRAAAAPTAPEPPARTIPQKSSPTTPEAERRRAPRGSVARALGQILTHKPGATITEIEQTASIAYPEVSLKSLGNDLRRLEGKRYRRDRPGGYKWFLTEEGKDEFRMAEALDAIEEVLDTNPAGVGAPAG